MSSKARIPPKVQRASGQPDDLARVPRTRPRARRGRRSFATRHRSRATSRCSARMEPAVRSPWIESAIITDRVRNVAFGLPNPKNSRQPTGIWPSKTLPRGTEFLDAETGGQNRAERPQVSPETDRAERYQRKSPQKRPIRSRRWDLRFG